MLYSKGKVLHRLHCLHCLFGCGWVGPKESNDKNLRASTRASFESKLARVDARNLADDLLLCCVLAACCG